MTKGKFDCKSKSTRDPDVSGRPCFRFREKVFSLQDSKLTQMFVSRHVKSSFNLIFSLLFWTFVLNVGYFFTHPHEFWRLVTFMRASFTDATNLFVFDLIFHAVILFLIRPLTKLWVVSRHSKSSPTWSDTWFVSAITIILLSVYAFSLHQIYSKQIQLVVCVAILCEKIRLTMKAIAFIIECRKKQERASEMSSIKIRQSFASFGQLLYFLFVPTIVYRDQYPRTERVRWQFVATYATQFIIGLVVLSLIFQRYLIPSFSKVGVTGLPIGDLYSVFFNSLLTGAALQMFAFYLFLHCWMNLWAEMLRFGDRTFYLDWWNSTNYSTFYRKWNCVVHDWIYAYFYVWIMNKTKGNKVISAFLVFLVSSIIHEYILSVAFGFVFPVLLILFAGFGTVLFLIETAIKKIPKVNSFGSSTNANAGNDPQRVSDHSHASFYPSNFFILASGFMGWSSMVVFYSFEYFARQNCAFSQKSWFENLFSLYMFQCVEIRD